MRKMFSKNQIEEIAKKIAEQYAGVNIEDIPHLDADPDDLTEEQFNQVKGKAWYATGYVEIIYPINDSGFFMIDAQVLGVYKYSGTGDSFECTKYEYDLSQIGQGGGTQLYKHHLYNSSMGYSIDIISSSNEDFTTTSSVLPIVNVLFNASGGETNERVFIKTTEGGGGPIVFIESLSFYVFATSTNFIANIRSNFTDTITEL